MCRRSEIQEKVYQLVVITDLGFKTPCHIWQGSHSGDGRGGGYPRMCLNGQTMAVHRVMYTNEYGIIPGKKQIDHKCRNRMCVNPDHLEMVTHKENQRRRDDARNSNPKPINCNDGDDHHQCDLRSDHASDQLCPNI